MFATERRRCKNIQCEKPSQTIKNAHKKMSTFFFMTITGRSRSMGEICHHLYEIAANA